MPALERVKWAPGRKAEFILHMQQQLVNTIGDRAPLERKWEEYLMQWRAQLPEGEIDFPYPGASDVEMPLTAIHSDPVYADLFQTLHAPEDYWTPVAKREDRVDVVNSFRQGTTAVEKRFIKMRQINRRALLDNNILGTAIYKNHWYEQQKSVLDYNEFGRIERVAKRLSQPRIEHVPLQNFFFPANAWSLDPDQQGGAVWTAERFEVTPGQLRVWAEGGDDLPAFDREAVKKVLQYLVDEQQPVDDVLRSEDNFVPFENRRIKLYELQARFDVNGDNIEEDIVCIFHLEIPELLRAIYNPSLHGKRPHRATNYLPGFGVYGIGIAEIDAWAQEAATKLLNGQIDNVLLANTRMYSAPIGSNIQPGEPVYPGKIWLTDPGEQVREIRLSDIYPSVFQTLGQLMQFSEMRTGVSEIRQGNLTGLPSRTPATSLLSILREGNKRFDMILSNFRDVHSEMGLRMLQNLAQHAREEPERWTRFFVQAIGQKDALAVMQILQESIHDIEESFGVTVTATSAQVNKEVEKQSFIGLLQVIGQVGSQLVQVGQLAEQTPPDSITHQTSTALYSGGVELLKQLLQRFDIQNPSDYLGNMEAIAAALSAQQNGGNAATAGLSQLGSLTGPAPPQAIPPEQLGRLFGLS